MMKFQIIIYNDIKFQSSKSDISRKTLIKDDKMKIQQIKKILFY